MFPSNWATPVHISEIHVERQGVGNSAGGQRKMSFSSMLLASSRSRLKSPKAKLSIHPSIISIMKIHSSTPSPSTRPLQAKPSAQRLPPQACQSQSPRAHQSLHYTPYFFGPNLGAPIFAPLSLMPSTLSIDDRIFWSGVADPRSKSATIEAVVLHLVARSFCVIFGSIFWRWSEITLPTSLPTVLGLTISSLRSTLVRRWPSPPPDWGGVSWCFDVRIAAHRGGWRGRFGGGGVLLGKQAPVR